MKWNQIMSINSEKNTHSHILRIGWILGKCANCNAINFIGILDYSGNQLSHESHQFI